MNMGIKCGLCGEFREDAQSRAWPGVARTTGAYGAAKLMGVSSARTVVRARRAGVRVVSDDGWWG